MERALTGHNLREGGRREGGREGGRGEGERVLVKFTPFLFLLVSFDVTCEAFFHIQ